MRMAASMCLVLMEMTGAPNTLPFLMMVRVCCARDSLDCSRGTMISYALSATLLAVRK